ERSNLLGHLAGPLHVAGPAVIDQRVIPSTFVFSIANPFLRKPVSTARAEWGSQPVALVMSVRLAPRSRLRSAITLSPLPLPLPLALGDDVFFRWVFVM